MIEEGALRNWTFGGNDLSGMLVSFVGAVTVAKGVSNEQSRARFVHLAHAAVVNALPGEKRRITSYCVRHL